MRSNNRAFERAMALAALSGLKIALGPAFLATSRRWPSRQNWVMAAAGRDGPGQAGGLPPAVPAPPADPAQPGRRLGGPGEHARGRRGRPLGRGGRGAVAAGVAVAAPIARIAINKVVGVPDALLGLGEDYLALPTAPRPSTSRWTRSPARPARCSTT